VAVIGALLMVNRPVASRHKHSIEELAHVYHGVPLDRQRRPIEITPVIVLDMLDSVVDLGAAQSEAQGAVAGRETLAATRDALFRGQSLSPTAELLVRGALAERALELAPPLVRQRYAWKVEYLRIRARDLRFPRLDERQTVFGTIELPAWLRDRVRDPRWNPRGPGGGGWPSEPNAYAGECSAAGVPLPPDWGNAAWQLQGVLPQGRLFLQLGNPVQVYAYSDSNVSGACIALPRWSGASVTLGIICQSATTARACFWDNRPHAGSPLFTPAQMAANSVQQDWVNGGDAGLIGGGKCTNCHRGENVFVIHPGTPLQVGAPFDTSSHGTWYQPNTSLGWTNPPATAFATGGGCTGCHQIASTTDPENGSYCAILEQAANGEMPSTASPANWTTPAAPYAAHINALKANCP